MSGRLLLLVGTLLIPLMVMGLGVLWMQYQAERSRAEDRLVEQARSLARLVDQEFTRAEATAVALAASSALARGDFAAFDGEMRATRDRLAASLGGGDSDRIAFFGADGRRRLYTADPPGVDDDSPVGSPFILAALVTGQTQVSDIINEPALGPPRAAIAVPVFGEGGERRIAGAIAISVARQRLLSIVHAADLPEHGIATLLDRSGLMIARSANDGQALGKRPALAALAAIDAAPSGLVPGGTQTMEGVRVITAFASAPLSGYAVKLDVPESEFLAPFRALLLRGGAVGALVLSAALVLSLLFRHRIVAAFQRVPSVAAGGAGGTTGLREADDLAAALMERAQADAKLRALFNTNVVGVVISDTHGRVHVANGAFLDIIGRSRAELEAGTLRWDEITPPEWRDRDAAAIAEVLVNSRCTPYEKAFTRPDGAQVPVMLSAGLIDATTGMTAAFIVDLRTSRAAEAKRQDTEAVAQRILQATSDSVMVLDAEGRIMFMNESGRRHRDIEDMSAIVGRSMDSLWLAESAPLVREAISRASQGETARITALGPSAGYPVAETRETRSVRDSARESDTPAASDVSRFSDARNEGAKAWWDVMVAPLPAAEGGAPRLLAVARDVTEARRAEATLRDNEIFLRSVLDASSDCVMVIELDGTVASMNEQGQGLMEVDDVRGHPWASLWPEAGGELVRHALAEAVSGRESRFEAYGPTAKGRPKWWDVTVAPARDANGYVVRIVAAARDITWRKAAEDALRDNEVYLRDLLATLDLGAFLAHGTDGTIVHWSQGCAQLYGWTAEEALGQNVHELLRTQFPVPQPEIEAALHRDGVWKGDFRQRTRDEQELIVVAHKALRPGHGGRPDVVMETLTDVTEQRRAEAALADSEARLRAVLDTAPVGVLLAEAPSGRLLFGNAWMERIVRHPTIYSKNVGGYGEWAGFDAGGARLMPEEYPLARVLATGEPSSMEIQYQCGDGVRRWVALSGAPVRDPGGRMTAAVLVCQDIDAARTAEVARAESEARLRAALEASDTGTFRWDLLTNALEWDEALDRLFGLPPGQTAKSLDQFLALVHPEDRDAVVTLCRRCAAEGTDFDMEFRVVWPDGSVHWLYDRGKTFRDSSGRPVAMTGACLDITQRKTAEAALRASEARFRAITEAMPQMVWSARPDGHYDFFNARWYEFTGIMATAPAEEWINLAHPEDEAQLMTLWRHSLMTGDPYEYEYRLRRHDGVYRWVLARALPMRNAPDAAHPQGEIIRWFGTSTDVTDIVEARDVLARSRAELESLVAARTAELHETQARLAHAQRMEALGQLAGGIAHDFNNILQAVQGGAGLIERRPGDATSTRRLARLVREAADRGSAITRRLLAFSRRGELRTEAVDALGLLTEMREVLSHTLSAEVTVRVETEADLPAMLVDKAQLETVLVNLATNARDAMPKGGTLTLAASHDMRATDHEVPVALKAGRYIRLTVADTGTGMPPDILARVAEPFFTTKEAGKGTGLGVAMAKGFAEQSGGGLHIASVLDKGTTVTLWFPVADDAAPVKGDGPAAVPAGDADERGACILLVDDDAAVRQLTAEGLEEAGYLVTTAGSGAEALELLHAGQPVDLLVSDLSMPGMNGIALIREVQRRRRGVPAVLVTGHAGDAAALAISGVVSGSFSLLRKPVTTESLAERIAMLLEGTEAADRRAGGRSGRYGRAGE